MAVKVEQLKSKIMKKSFLVAGIIFGLSGMVFASNGESAVDRILHKKISYPEALRAKGIEAKVNVRLKVNEQGKLEIISMDSDSKELKEAVERQVKQLKFKAEEQLIGSVFNYSFNFKVQN